MKTLQLTEQEAHEIFDASFDDASSTRQQMERCCSKSIEAAREKIKKYLDQGYSYDEIRMARYLAIGAKKLMRAP